MEHDPDFGRVMRNILQPVVKGRNIYMPGETLRRDNVDWRVVRRVEDDGRERGSFISE